MEVTCVPATMKHYRSRGYILPKPLEKFRVKAIDLKAQSKDHIEATCDLCGVIYCIRRDAYNRQVTKRCLCRKCLNRTVVAVKEALSYEEVEKRFSDNGCVLLSTEYSGSKVPLEYMAKCGHKTTARLNNFVHSLMLCDKCTLEHGSKSIALPYDYVKRYLKDHSCTLLTKEYHNAHQKLKYICSCGNIGETSFYCFQQGIRCHHCYINKVSGVNNYSYNHDLTSEEREKSRSYKEYYLWRADVFAKDKYTCQCCGHKGKGLNAHHIYNYADNKELRVVLSNGITLCKTCHFAFHTIYGKHNNTKEQLDEFISMNRHLNITYPTVNHKESAYNGKQKCLHTHGKDHRCQRQDT